jgi:glycolate oxidase FAD binding subunit
VPASEARRGEAEDAVDGIVPAWVVRPGDVGEVQACVARAERDGVVVVPAGLGAHLDVGGLPKRVDVLLRLDRLARVVDHQAADMTVTVEAGCPLPLLDATLAARGQWLPLDPPRAGRTTVGGLLAANLSGPLRATQGTARDLLLGIRVVGGGGALVAGGGRVVKNVAGYDLPKLHIGALGTLGVIVEATFKVRPRPAREEALVVRCRAAADAAALASALLDVDAPPLWIEIDGANDGDGATVSIGFGGIEEEIAAARTVAMRLAATRELHAIGDAAALRARLVDVDAGAALLRIGVLPRDVGGVLAHLLAAGVPLRFAVHAANGVVRAAIDDAAAVAPLVRALRPGLEARGGSLVVERAVPAVKQAVDVWGDPGAGLGLMRGVKAALDPAGVFAIGRFVGGI